jgi:hypothetical protein
MSHHLRFLEPKLSDYISSISHAEYRKLVLDVAEKAVRHVKLQDNRITQALEVLHAGKVGECPEQQALHTLAEELDDIALTADTQLEKGHGSEEAYAQAFCKARAADALESAFEADDEKAIAYTTYEAYHAADEDAELTLQWLKGGS